MTSKISTFDGIKPYCQQAICLQMWSCNDCWSRNGSKQRAAELFTIEESCKTSYWSDDENSKVQSRERSCGEQQSPRVKKGKKALVERKVGECFQCKSHGQCSKGDLCSFSHDRLAQRDLYSGERQNGRSSSPAPHSKAKTDEGGETSSKTGQERKLFGQKLQNSVPLTNCKNPSCSFWHLPVCHNYKSQIGCKFGRKCFFRHVEADEKPIKLCISRFLTEKVYSTWKGKLGSNHAVKFFKGTWYQKKNRERKGPSRCIIKKCELHELCLCAPKFGERWHEETLHQERCGRSAAWDLANIFTSSRMRTELGFTLLLKQW